MVNKLRIGILTLNGCSNYGNRLQNFAVQEILRDYADTVQTIKIDLKAEKNINSRISTYLKRLRMALNRYTISNWRDVVVEKLKSIPYRAHNEQKGRLIQQFTEEFIRETDFTLTRFHIPEDLSGKFDYFVVGSDQVWKPDENGLEIYLLSFADKSKRIALAASFGYSDISCGSEPIFQKYLPEMPFISVREKTGQDIIRRLTSREVPVLIDPTMFLSRSKWLELTRPSVNKPKTNYVLLYFLGKLSKHEIRWIDNFAKSKKLCLYDLNMDSKAGPREFVDAINNADFVFTDSFHGAVFSILMETPFLVFERKLGEKMHTRLNNLLELFQIPFLKWHPNFLDSEISHLDISSTRATLEIERRRFKSFLDRALS